MNRSVTAGLVVVALGVLGAAWFFGNYDLVSEREWQMPRPIVWRQRFLAAEQMLQRIGLGTRRVGALESAEGLGAESLLVVPSGRGAVSPRGIAAVVAFVERGGHLIVEPESADAADPLLDALGVGRQEIESGASGAWWPSKPLTDPNARTAGGLIEVKLGADAPPLLVFIGGRVSLHSDQATFRLGAEPSIRMLQLTRGAGRVTAINDVDFISNVQIGRNDNAELFWQLIHQSPTAVQVAFFRGRRQSLGPWLAENAPLASIALVAIVLAALWRAMPRFGSILPDPEPVRRRLLDHLSASGRLLWSAGRKGTLAQAAARGATAAVARHFPHFALMGPAEQAQFLCKRFGLAENVAEQVIAPTLAARGGAGLVQLTRACAHIHALLAPTPSPGAAAAATPSDPHSIPKTSPP